MLSSLVLNVELLGTAIAYMPIPHIWTSDACHVDAALGGLLGGYVGDMAAKRSPHHGRISACQFSVFIGIPFSFIILKVRS